jgi:tRNA(Arg) A34 adenosine deaminase TadA
VTESDPRRHPELDLAVEAKREFTADERARTVMYTSTEPCPMCAGGLRSAGLARVVYSVGGDEILSIHQGPHCTAPRLQATLLSYGRL